jgi:hypothetical protein
MYANSSIGIWLHMSSILGHTRLTSPLKMYLGSYTTPSFISPFVLYDEMIPNGTIIGQNLDFDNEESLQCLV